MWTVRGRARCGPDLVAGAFDMWDGVPMSAKQKKKKAVDRRSFNRPPPAPEGNKYAEGNDGGRPTSFRPEFVDQARQLCQLGATDVEVARFFKVHPCTIYEWRATIPEFSEALRIGKSLADERMKRSLYQRGIGYDYDYKSIKTEERVVGKTLKLVKRTTSIEHLPGDVGAQKLWLINRCPKEFREKVDVSHEIGPEMTASQALDDLIALLIEHGVQIAPPPGQTIEGEAETIGVARIAGPHEQGEQGDKHRRGTRPSRPARP
jgi:hypothetical protein